MRAKLQQLRKSNGYTQQTFSAAVGTSRSHYAQIETGDKQPALRLALRIKRVLNYGGTVTLLTHKNQLEAVGEEQYIKRQRAMNCIDMEAPKPDK